MSDAVTAAALAALLCGLGGLLVPALVARIPEPAPDSDDVEADDTEAADREAEPVREAADRETEPPKETYAAIAALPGLRGRTGVVSALVGGLLGSATGLDWPLVWLVPLVPVGVALSVIDWRTRLLPKRVVLPATLATIVLVVAVGLATGERDAVVRALGGMVAARSFFWLLWYVRSAGMGFGDVRLAAIVGLVLGWVGWGALAVGVWVGFVVFVVPGLALAVARRDRSLLRRPFPYGPSMLVGAVVGLVWGTALADRIWG